MNNEQMIKNSKAIDKLFKVIGTMMLVGSIIMIVFMILIPFVGSEKIMNPNTLLLGDIRVNFNDVTNSDLSSVKLVMELLIVPILIILVICWYGILMFRKVLEPMKIGRPFDRSSSKNIKKLGVFVIIGGIVINICKFVASYMEYTLCDINKIFNMDLVSISLDFSFEVGFIIIACILFLLAHVFSYGEELQTESDETL